MFITLVSAYLYFTITESAALWFHNKGVEENAAAVRQIARDISQGNTAAQNNKKTLRKLRRADGYFDGVHAYGKRFLGMLREISWDAAPLKESMTRYWAVVHTEMDAVLQKNFVFDRPHLKILQAFQAIGDAMPHTRPAWWDKGNYDRQLTDEIAFVTSWDEFNIEMKIEQDVRKRLELIHRFLASQKYENDAASKLRAAKYLAGRIMGSVMELEDNPVTENILIDIMPEVRDFKGIRLPLLTLYKRLQEYRSVGYGYETLKDNIESGIDKVKKMAENRSALMDSVLRKLLAGFGADGRREILAHMVDVMTEHYLFQLPYDNVRIWPIGVRPRTEVIKQGLTRRRKTPVNIVETLSREPVYLPELEAVAALIKLRCYQYELIDRLKAWLETMDEDEYELALSDVQDLEKMIEEYAYPERYYLQESGESFAACRGDIEQIKEVLERWNKEEKDAEKDRAKKEELSTFLIEYCERTHRPREGACAKAY